jgi:hypothetical protein
MKHGFKLCRTSDSDHDDIVFTYSHRKKDAPNLTQLFRDNLAEVKVEHQFVAPWDILTFTYSRGSFQLWDECWDLRVIAQDRQVFNDVINILHASKRFEQAACDFPKIIWPIELRLNKQHFIRTSHFGTPSSSPASATDLKEAAPIASGKQLPWISGVLSRLRNLKLRPGRR